MPALTAKKEETVIIPPANIQELRIVVEGTAPLVQHKFSEKMRNRMRDAMSTPASEKKGKKARPPRDYDQEFIDCQHIAEDGWVGIPCAAFRAAMIAACRATGLVMTKAKLAVVIKPDGFEEDEGTALVKLISKKPPEKHEALVRLETGVADVRIRPMWRAWSAVVTVQFDADMLSAEGVITLLDRAGKQVGIGEGRPFSKNSCGQGWGTFLVKGTK